MSDQRQLKLKAWLNQLYPAQSPIDLIPLNGDASFRRYFRTKVGIAADSPPDSQKNAEFVRIADALSQSGIHAAMLKAYDLTQGFLLEDDLGDISLFQAAAQQTDRQKELYQKAILLMLQLKALKTDLLPRFDEAFIRTELSIFTQWGLDAGLQLKLTAAEKTVLEQAFDYLVNTCVTLPSVPMHRDFHSRNLMVRDNELYLIDFQDMVLGPYVYDLASLIYDCYVDLPADLSSDLLHQAFTGYQDAGLTRDISFEEFCRQVRTVSLQRHLKVLGLFFRLQIRDHKSGYLKDLPRVLKYAVAESADLPACLGLHQLLSGKFKEALACEL